MNAHNLLKLIRRGEDSTLEFKRDDVRNHDLARELTAFLNLEGGVVLLGVEDDGRISGATRERLQEWAAEACRTKIEPPVIPHMAWLNDPATGRRVLSVGVPRGPDKPYACLHNNRKTYYIRVGDTVQEASREELERMFQASGRLQYGLKPVPGSGLEALDLRRLDEYFTRVLGGECPSWDDAGAWERLLCNVDLMTEAAGQTAAAVDGMLLFGKEPKRYLPQSGIRALCYPGAEPGYAARADEYLLGPMTPLRADNGSFVEIGLVEQAWDFVRRNTAPSARLEGLRRIDRWEFPEDVVRETIVNALVHRDYSIAGADISLTIYADRLEVESPGRLPNTVTVEKMKAGSRYARNQTLVGVMRDYSYMDARGMGVRSKIIPGMLEHNGTEPDLIEENGRFTVRLWK